MTEDRYTRQTMLPEVGEQGQRILANSKVIVVGAGGLGSPILLYLTAAGIGQLGIMDNDTVSISNLQRQVLYSTAQIGASKAILAKERLSALNPEIQLKAYTERLTKENIHERLSEYDIVVDATDNYTTRILLDDYCSANQKPLVHGSVSGFTGQVSVFNTLKAGRYTELFPQVESKDDTQAIGVLGAVAGTVGAIEAAETVKLLLHAGTPLANKLLTINLLTNDFTLFEIA